jgi:signal transduction histidine kinase
VIAERSGRAIYDPLSVSAPRGAPALGVARRGVLAHADPAAVLSSLLYTERDTARVATIAAVAGSALVVISSGVIDEFAHSFAQVRLTDLVLALSLTAMLALAFVLVTRRTTRPLEVLTAAATEIGRGNFLPALPPAGDDEVGRLTSAFTTMSGHVDRMMKEIEVSRQMAAVGSFAQQIAHEIRNPLTSIKLNLQSLERDVRDGVVGPDSRRTVEICLEEIQRLDRVVRGVLKLGRARSNGQERASLTGIVERALDIVRPQLVQQRVQLVYTPPPAPSSIIADEEQLVGMFLNLFVNAAEAMPHGGTLRVVVARSDGVGHDTVARITVSDTGPGVAAIARNRIFDPFFTTKNEGSGFGLAVALRDAEQHHGRITLAERSGEIGATFLVELPIARDESV